jgi:hypothetical protein
LHSSFSDGSCRELRWTAYGPSTKPGSPARSLRVALAAVIVIVIVIIFFFFAVAFVFLFVFFLIWLLSKQDIGSQRPIRKV